MTHRISILIRADVGRDTIELIVSGCLNKETSTALATQIAKAQSLDPAAPVVVDLSNVRHIDPAVLEQLRDTAEAAQVADGNLPGTRFITPEMAASCSCADCFEAIS